MKSSRQVELAVLDKCNWMYDYRIVLSSAY